MDFYKYAEKGNIFLREIALELGTPKDLDRAKRVLRAVFRVLRDRLTLEESFDMLSQLPLIIKAMYIDGWKPGKAPEKIKQIDEFIQWVCLEAGNTSNVDFGDQAQAKKVISAVFRIIKKHVSSGEMADIEWSLPKPLREFILNA